MLPFGMAIYAPLADGDPRGLLGILPQADPTHEPRRQAGRGREHLHRVLDQRLQPVAQPVERPRRHAASGATTPTVAIALGGISLTLAARRRDLLFADRRRWPSLVCVAPPRRHARHRARVAASWRSRSSRFPTRVHERYLFPALALGALLIFSGRAWPWIYARACRSSSSRTSTGSTPRTGRSSTDPITNPGARRAADGRRTRCWTRRCSPTGGIWLLGLLVTVCSWLSCCGSRSARARAARERPGPPASREPRGRRRLPRDGPRLPGDRPTAPRWLAVEPGRCLPARAARRLDRRDALIAPRPHRLRARLPPVAPRRAPRPPLRRGLPRALRGGVPQRLGQRLDRDVYEWTHPMLAKYLIAAGIVRRRPEHR